MFLALPIDTAAGPTVAERTCTDDGEIRAHSGALPQTSHDRDTMWRFVA